MQRYLNEIIRPIVKTYAGAVGDDFVLMNDNAVPIGNWYDKGGEHLPSVTVGH